MAVRVAQSSRQVDEGWWKWSAWIEGDESELLEIEKVVWRLHPTFPNPVIESRARKRGFRIDSAGWGEFRLYATIYRKGSAEAEMLSHDLTLADGDKQRAPQKVPSAKPNPQTGRVFLSYSLGDREIAEAIERVVNRHGWEVSSGHSVDPCKALVSSIEDTIRSTDAVIVVNAGGSPWVESEGRFASSLAKPVLEVKVRGTDAKTQPVMLTAQTFIDLDRAISNSGKSKLDKGIGDFLASTVRKRTSTGSRGGGGTMTGGRAPTAPEGLW